MNKIILIQQRALACLSKSVAHILQRELYTEGSEVVFDSILGDEETPSPQLLHTSIPQSTCRRSPPFFEKRLASKQCSDVLNIITNGYILLFISKPNFDQVTRPFKKTKLWPLVSCLFCRRNRNCENVKSLGVLQSPVSSTQA